LTDWIGKTQEFSDEPGAGYLNATPPQNTFGIPIIYEKAPILLSLDDVFLQRIEDHRYMA
jgi:hypothetical protein